jgi:exopolysaccharide biosynthesis polyprenyl glycosylphosphotransferase
MKNNRTPAYNVSLLVGDFAVLTVAFIVAYVLRVSISHVPVSTDIPALTYTTTVVSILPFWILIYALLGLYTTKVYQNRFSELARLTIGTLIGTMAIISYGYIANTSIFPARLVVLYSLLLALAFVLVFRTVMRHLRRQLFSYGIGINKVLLVGDNAYTVSLAKLMTGDHLTGDKIIGIVGGTKHRVDPGSGFRLYADFDEAVAALKDGLPTTIVQTELYGSNERNQAIMEFAQQHHIDYRFVPGNNELLVGNIDVELFHTVPMVSVHQTPLIGWGRVVKRAFDLAVCIPLILITSPIMLLVAIAVKLEDGGPVFLRQVRLTRFNHEFEVFKFRSLKQAYNGMGPEEGFTKMGRPELIKEFRANGNFLPKDPRNSRIGNFIRAVSLDELPQLFNVFKGELSLVGPRALLPRDLAEYKKKHTILSVKSGITGLAQVSGRNNLPVEERRRLDVYYAQNWSLWLDIIILLKTFRALITHEGSDSQT